MDNKFDKDTNEVIHEGRALELLTGSDGWQEAKKMADDLIRDLTDIRKIPDDLKGEEKLRQIDIRAGAASLFEQWVKDVEAKVERYQENLKNLETNNDKGDIIRQYQ